MLDLVIRRTMRLLLAGLALNCVLWAIRAVPPAIAQAGATAEITAPTDGEILQGEVRIRGTAAGAAFSVAELSFAYLEDPTDTWFRIAELAFPVENGELWTWNTASVSDGEYLLRLRLVNLDGALQDARVHIQIRNYTQAIVATPTQQPTTAPPMQVDTPVVIQPSPTAAVMVARMTPTPFPGNPAALTPAAILGGFWRGGLAVVAASLLVTVMIMRRRR